jgi:DNA-binding FadR family transcriptional regulator
MPRKHRDVMGVLTAEIVSGRRRAGEMLPREVDLAAAFGVSRGVARETIRALEERGMISVRHGKGATISEPDKWDLFDPVVLRAVLQSEHGARAVAELVECWRIVEVGVAGLAAERASRRDIDRLTAALDQMRESAAGAANQGSEGRFCAAHAAFHDALVVAARNHALAALVQRIHATPRAASPQRTANGPYDAVAVPARFLVAAEHYRREGALPEQQRVVDAVAAHEPDNARHAMSDHLDTIARYLTASRRRRIARGSSST